jgi:hypothetical protein
VTWLVWRQHRNQAYLVAAGLAAFAVLFLITGRQMASQYQSALKSCTASHTCGSLGNTLNLGNPVLSLLINLTLLVPCLLGAFWGGPLVARELETGTSQFAWMQSVTRSRWLIVKVGWVLLAATVGAGAIAAIVTWWSGPVNAVESGRFLPGQFDVQGIAPVGYALFAVALGIAAGALLRRTVPALAVTIGVYAAVRIAIAEYLRPHYMTAIYMTYKLSFGHQTPSVAGSYLLISRGVVGPAGHAPSSAARFGASVDINGTRVSNLTSACRAAVFQGPSKFFSCLNADGYRAFITYQPASRFWAFQGIETGVFVILAAALLAVTAFVVLRRDA